MVFLLEYAYSQLFYTPAKPTRKFTGQTIIVTGSNVGMGLEAARYLVRLDAAKVILAVRSLEKGAEAKASIEASENKKGVVEVWQLDLSSYESVRQFAAKAQELPRLDIVIENAGIYVFDFQLAEKDESTITVNVINTMYLAFLLLPKLRETATKFNIQPVLTFTGSFVHYLTFFPERKEPNIFAGLRDPKKARMIDRYNVSKTIELLLVRELANQITASSKPKVTASIMNPGHVKTAIMRDAKGIMYWFVKITTWLSARTTEVGGRTLVNGAEGGAETHGAYLNDNKPGKVSGWVRSADGAATQKKLWSEFLQELDTIEPGVTKNL